jgi:hypothetical protein
MAKDPTTVATLWANRLQASQTEIAAGVNAVTEAPGVRAARNQAGYLAGVQNSVAKWARNTSAVTLSDWQQSMINKGIPRVGPGAQAAIPKMTAFMSKWLPYVEQAAQTVRAMPNVTLQDGIARAVAQIQANANFPGYR